MLLTAKDRENIRSTKFHKHYKLDKQGKPLESDGLDLRIEKLRKHIIGQLSEIGFQVEKVKPSKANCIIRIYKGNYNNPDWGIENSSYCLFGADCFTKGYTKEGMVREWITDNQGEEIEMNFSKWEYRLWLFQDDYITIDTEFFDTYVRVSKKG